jgi:hypothetical protein
MQRKCRFFRHYNRYQLIRKILITLNLKETVMKKILFVLLSVCILSAGLVGCEKEKEESLEYPETFTGKWQPIARGETDDSMQFIEKGGVNIEFRSDGTMLTYNSVGTSIFPYKVEYDLLFQNHTDPANTFIYKYKFNSEYNELTLTLISGNIVDIYPFYFVWRYKKI